MTRLEQRGAVAFTCTGVAVVVILLITPFGHLFLADDAELASLPWLLDQPKLLRLLAHLILVPALAGSAAYAIGEACKWPIGLSRQPSRRRRGSMPR